MALSDEQQFELNRRLRCFFLDGSNNREEYTRVFNGLYPEESGRYAYSPLFLLRRDIYLFLRFNHFCNELKVDHIAHFPALLLADIIIEGFVFNITAKKAGEVANYDDFKEFYEKYFSFNEDERLITKQLRHALQHNFNQLIIRIKNKEKQQKNFEVIKKYLEKKRGSGIDKGINFFKLGYQLSSKFPAVAEFDSYKTREKYFLVYAKVNPVLLLDRLEIAIRHLLADIQNNDGLAINFLKNLTVDNWMKVFKN